MAREKKDSRGETEHNKANPPGETKEKKNSNKEFMEKLSQSTEEARKKRFWNHLGKKIKNKEFSLIRDGVNGVITEYKNFNEEKEETIAKYMAYETVAANAADTMEYYILLILSCLIATMGLYQNSAAVIIGAMIVAPLMGPIMGFSAGVLWGSARTIAEALTTLLKGIVLVLFLTWALTSLIPFVKVEEQILARTAPGLGDIIVAIASGLVGAYAFVNNRVSSSMPGVAISVALMPPLCTVGIGLGLQEWEIAQGAALLFSINLVGISLAAIIIFYLVKLHPKEGQGVKKRFIRQIVISLILLGAIITPLSLFTVKAVKDNNMKQELQSMVLKQVEEKNIYFSEYDITSEEKKVRLILFTPEKVDQKALAEGLEKLAPGTNLELYFLKSGLQLPVDEGSR